MKKTGIAVAVVVAIGLVGTAGAWYTGTKMEAVLRDAVAQSNGQIEKVLPGSAVRLEMTDFQRGVFSSSARYELSYPGPEEKGPVTIVMLDRVQHGPFPLSRLAKLKLLPVMATSEAVLERSDYLAPLFTASGDETPIVVKSTVGYGNSIDGSINVAALVFESDEGKAEFSPGKLSFSTDMEGEAVLIDGRSDGMRLTATSEAGEPVTVNVSGLTLFADRHRGVSEFYIGEGRMGVEKLEVETQGDSTLVLEGLAQSDTLTEDESNLAGTLDFDISKVSYQGQELGSAGMKWTFSRFDQKATADLNELYNQITMSAYRGEEPQVEPERWSSAFASLLAAQPQLALDLLVIRTPSGESRARAGIELASPESFGLPIQDLVPQLLASLDAHVQLSKPMLRDIIMYKTLFEPGMDAEVVAAEAEIMVEMVAGMAESTKLARQEEDNLVTKLTYSDGNIELNGEVIPPEALAGLLALFNPANPAVTAE
ncbi:MAG: hypothetical protein ACJAXR_000798 [Halopseudomonas sp.]|jgi:uncharacterized protein YdgA (DUF945 family)|uniref:YdgA family protein n=1 Tax=Halopseudomonas sp. TaxID=2901191 RepID=UPI0039E28760